jgi:hypothetical protein
MANLVPFGEYSEDAAKRDRESLDSEGKGEFIKIKEGKNLFRILPPPPKKDSPFMVTYVHYIPLADDPDSSLSFVCPRMMTKELARDERRSCKACDESARVKNSGNALDRDFGYNIRAQRRVYASVVNRRDPEAGLRVFGFGKGIHDDLVAMREDEDDPTDFTHPLEGYDVVIRRKGTTKTNTKYRVTLANRSSQLHPDVEQMNDWITNQFDLSRYAQLPSDRDLVKMLRGERIERRNTDNSAGGRRALPENSKSTSRASASDDDDDIIEGEFEEEDDDFPETY